MITLDKQQVIQSIEKVLDTSKVGVLSTDIIINQIVVIWYFIMMN